MMNLKERKQACNDRLDKAVVDMAPEATDLLNRLNQQLSFKNWSGAADTVRAIKKNPLANADFKKMLKSTPGAKKIFARLGVI